MPKATNVMPNVDAVEVLNHAFDFTNALPSGVTIASTGAPTLTVLSGTDPSPASRINGGPTTTGALVIVSIGPFPNVVEGNVVTYRRTCQVTLSDGEEPNLYVDFTVTP